MEKRAGMDDAVLEAKLKDAVRIAEHGRLHFVGFLDERQAGVAQSCMRRAGFSNYLLWGGYEEAERVLFGAFPDYLEACPQEFPLETITASYRGCDQLTHRDFLGALLSKGVVRETLGDILVEPGRAVLFARAEIADFLLQQTEKIGRVGVKLARGAQEPLPEAHTFAPFSGVVASARLDCIAALAVGLSREKAAGLISAGLVMLNHEVVTSVSTQVPEGAKLSVRGKGRYILDRVGPVTKKGRLSVAGRKYI